MLYIVYEKRVNNPLGTFLYFVVIVQSHVSAVIKQLHQMFADANYVKR